jgi:hypothetical protein
LKSSRRRRSGGITLSTGALVSWVIQALFTAAGGFILYQLRDVQNLESRVAVLEQQSKTYETQIRELWGRRSPSPRPRPAP